MARELLWVANSKLHESVDMDIISDELGISSVFAYKVKDAVDYLNNRQLIGVYLHELWIQLGGKNVQHRRFTEDYYFDGGLEIVAQAREKKLPVLVHPERESDIVIQKAKELGAKVLAENIEIRELLDLFRQNFLARHA